MSHVLLTECPELHRLEFSPTKLRLEIAAKRLRARKLGSRTLITADDLEAWASALPDIHDVTPNTVAKRVARAEATDT